MNLREWRQRCRALRGTPGFGALLGKYLVSISVTAALVVCAVLLKADGPGPFFQGDRPAAGLLVRQTGGLLTDAEEDASEAYLTAQNIANAGWRVVDGRRQYYFTDGSQAIGTVRIDGADVTFDEQGTWLSSRLDVPYISQLPDMPFGCEAVSVTMMLNYAGIETSKEDVVALLPYAGDPNLGFTGSVYYQGFSLGGIIWPPALLDLVRAYGQDAVDLTGASWEEVCAFIDEGRPVCVWFRTAALDHTVLLTGYSDATVWVNDPLADKDTALDSETFLSYWSQNDYRALSYL
ncbi:MAG: C39 family peptidase [Coriobacteriales bacterium]|jgi:uncharacterized protein YvpB|nr:C39 family peptidase [Coriobacteriales bacterium]